MNAIQTKLPNATYVSNIESALRSITIVRLPGYYYTATYSLPGYVLRQTDPWPSKHDAYIDAEQRIYTYYAPRGKDLS
jgi:hypothetical protein